MNLASIVILIIVLALIVVAIVSIVKRRRNKGPCGMCPYAGSCDGHCEKKQ